MDKRARRYAQDDIEDFWNKQPVRKRKKLKHRGIKRLFVTVIILTILYCVAVFSEIPVVAKWRTIYIETAMSTKDHQWLATMFIPESIINKVIMRRNNLDARQYGLSSHWKVAGFFPKDLYLPWEQEKNVFSSIYNEIDQRTFNDFMNSNGDKFIKNNYLIIDKSGLNDGGTSIKTVHGDQVLAIDTENAISIIKISGDGYVGRLAIVKDPSRVGIGLSANFDKMGATVGEIAKTNNAVLAINANGFYDPDGRGDGGDAYGLVISGGKFYKKALGGTFKSIGLDNMNRLNIGGNKSHNFYRDAAEFKPALVVDGKIVVTGSDGWGIQPRSAIGQTKDGEILLLIVDGRAPGYSIGCTVGELAIIMKRYGAYEASTLDGGSSSLLYYRGREISRPSAGNKVNGRYVPDGFVVHKRTS